MLKKIRILLAGLCFVGMALLFLDESGFFPRRLAFLAKVQLVPALLAGSFVVVAVLLAGTLLFGRIYCSVVCPLGIFQDVAAAFGRKGRYRFVAGKPRLRVGVLAVFLISFLVGVPVVFGVLEPYGAFGRIAGGLFAPAWQTGGNALAYLSEITGYLMLARVPVWIRGVSAFAAAALTCGVVGYLAFRGGRIWCNTACPVGAALGFAARFSILQPRIHAASCTGCGRCETHCKASCIDAKNASRDASRCVSCFNCVDACRCGAIQYALRAGVPKTKADGEFADASRRGFMVAALGFLVVPVALRSAWAKDAADGKNGEIPALTRKTRGQKDVPVIPPGAGGLRRYSSRCTGCQLCVSTCPNHVLVSSDRGLGMLQPSLTFERGYCRVNCTECAAVCPTGAILPITAEEKSAIQIGRAKVDRDRCIRRSADTACNTCIRNCPAGAIRAIQKEDGSKDIAVDEERCVGCGACEYFCPVRPTSAIVVQGNLEHRRI